MKLKICNRRYDDFFIIEGNSTEELIELVKVETFKRDWKDEDCFSIEIGVSLKEINNTIQISKETFGLDAGEISDGYHTFNELYFHRMILFSIICNSYKEYAWKSWKHYDNTMYKDYFIVGISTLEGDYTYHYHKDFWGYFKVKELDTAPVWDGHKPEDVTRLLSLL